MELKKAFGGRKSIDMTQGKVATQLISFAIPLIMGNLVQQLYNTVDAWVVGNFVSNEAFAAVGTVGAITNLIIYFFSGLAGGSGVVLAQYYGAREYEKIHQTVHTFVVITFILGVFFSIFGVVMTPTFLRLMGTAPSVMPESTAYLRIYFSGILGLFVYNMASSVLRSVGDSRRPFLFLAGCAILNIILDLVFVIVFHMGVKGVAYATIISQAFSAIMGFIALLKSDTCVKVTISKLKIYPEYLRRILRQGLPASIQMSVTSFSSIFVQSYMYQFGADVMSGYAAYGKINAVMQMAVQSLGTAASTFVGQNVGKGDIKRAKKGMITAAIMIMMISVVIAPVLIIFAPQLIGFFNDKPEVVECGTLLLRLMNCFYFVFGIATVCSASIRGSGNPRVSMVIILSSYVVSRQIYLYIVSNFISNTLLPIALAVPFSWIVAATACIIYIKKKGLGKPGGITAAKA